MRSTLLMAFLLVVSGIARAEETVHQNTIDASRGAKSNLKFNKLPLVDPGKSKSTAGAKAKKPASKSLSTKPAKVTTGDKLPTLTGEKKTPPKGTAVGSEKPEGETPGAAHTGIKSETTAEKKGGGAIAGNLNFNGKSPAKGNLTDGKVGPSMNCSLAGSGQGMTEAAMRAQVGRTVNCYNAEARRNFRCRVSANNVADDLLRDGKTIHPSRFGANAVNGGATPTAVALQCDGQPSLRELGIKDPMYYIGKYGQGAPDVLDFAGADAKSDPLSIRPANIVLWNNSIGGGGGSSGGGGGAPAPETKDK